MIHILVSALLLGSVACQQDARREAAGDASVALPARPADVTTSDPEVRAAQAELAAGRPVLASKRVMPVLQVPERRTPEALLVAARAASEWRGWTMVNALLAFEPWLDTRFDGEARELLARSALERGEDSLARVHADAALRAATAPGTRAVRLALLARSLDRLSRRDTAAVLYQRAAELLPPAREWLLLRAAGTNSDARERQRLYDDVKSPAAKARIDNTEAQTLERMGQYQASAAAYEKLNDHASAYRLRLLSDDAGQRSTLRAGLLGYIQRDAQGADLQRAFEVLDAAFPDLDATSELIATRRAADAGIHARAAAGFARVPAAQLTDADVLAWAKALMATGSPGNAATRLAARRFGPAAAPEALYLRGLGNLRAGRNTAARTVLRQVIARHRNTRFASDAFYLLADMDSDAGRDAPARDLLSQACLNTPAGGFSDNACFRSGILSFVLGNASRAATAFDEIEKRFPTSSEAMAALYWAGRAWERAGNAATARERWRAVLEREPYSYYAGPAARRLGVAIPVPPPTELLTPPPTIRAALTRAEVLDRLGMDVEERYEYEGIENAARGSADEVLGAGAGLVQHGEVVRAIRLGWRVVTGQSSDSGGQRDPRGYSLVYPLLREVELVAHSRANRLDPALVAAVIRQESSWNPRAVSRAGARGLMQLMPPVGQAIARSKKYPLWDPALLFDPDVSLELGTSHLRAALSEHSNLARALAAYNAGGSRVRRWIRRGGTSDPEIFIERIPFVETRDYVRIVLRNAEMYRALHGLTR